MLTYAAHNVQTITFDGSQPVARGPKIAEFEQKLAAFTGVSYAVAVNSGTSALYLAARVCGFKGKRIAVPSITFCGTANAVIMAGGTPVFADVGWDGNISVDWLKEHDSEWDGVMPVHYAGNVCDMAAIRLIASQRPMVADGCHALGGFRGIEYADAVCLSFHPAKQITTGEGGAILTNDANATNKLRALRHNGIVSAYEGCSIYQNVWIDPSLNFWMSDIAAALGIEQLSHLPQWRAERIAMSRLYRQNLPAWAVPVIPPERTIDCAWCMYPVLLDLARIGTTRHGVMEQMRTRGIETQIHYQPLHLQPMAGYSKILPVAQEFGARELTLPLHNKMNSDDVLRVCAALKEIHG